MTIRTIDVGEEPNDETGDTLRDGGIIINENFAELDTRTAAAQAKADQGVTDAAKAQDAAAAAKAVADAALPRSALGVTVAQLVSGKVPAPQLPEFVEPVAGKGLSSNDFTTPEKTKLSTLVNPASYGVGGPAPLVDNIYQVRDGGITYWNQATTGRPPTGVQGNLISMTGGLNGSASTFIATSLDEDKVLFSRVNGATRAPWKQFLLAGDQGIGGPAIPVPEGDCNKAVAAGNYRTIPTTLNGRNVYGVLEVFDYGDNGNSKIQRLTATYGHPIGEATWFRSGTDQGTRWSTWQRLVAAGDFGIGSTSVPSLTDLNVFSGSGFYRFGSSAANNPSSPGMFGTVCIAMFNDTNWTQIVVGTSSPETLFTRACVNGAIQPWQRQYTEVITNANGTAVKFPDGTMICRTVRKDSGPATTAVSAGLFINAGVSFQWPVAFVGDMPVATAVSESYSVSFSWIALNVGATLTGISDVRIVSSGSGALSKVLVSAVGRWK